MKRVGVAGLGAVGMPVVRALAAGIEGLELAAVSSRDLARARGRMAGVAPRAAIVHSAALPELADIVVECVPKAAFAEVAAGAIEAGRTLVTVSGAALLVHDDLVRRARETGATIVLATGALLGLDAVRAAAEGEIAEVRMITRKPPRSLEGAPYLEENGIAIDDLDAPLRVFEGTAREGAAGSRQTSTSPPRSASPVSDRTARGWRSGPIPVLTATPTKSSSTPTAPDSA